MATPPCPYCGSTAGPEHPCSGKLLGRLLDGRYQIEAVLGQGGMGMVFRATQVTVKRAVAVKTLHPSLAAAPQFFERFRREAEVASRLNHPNVITVFDFGRTDDGVCYFVMELIHGESLKQLVKRDGPLPLRRAMNLIEQAARGLSHAHQQHVIHRDIKPHNLLISSVDGSDFVKVLDFGLVKALEVEDEDQLTSTGQVLGTPQYMSPEQAGGETVDARSDLYSLAGVFYFCLTGSSPFGAGNVRKALQAALFEQVPPVSSRRQGAPVPKAIDGFFRQALAADPEKRFQNAEEFVSALRDVIFDTTDEDLDAMPSQPRLREVRGERKMGGTPASQSASARSGKGSRSRPPRPVLATPALPEPPTEASRSRSQAQEDSGAPATSPDLPSLKAQRARIPKLPRREGLKVRNTALVLVLLLALGGGVGAMIAWRTKATAGQALPPADSTLPTSLGATNPSAIPAPLKEPTPPPPPVPQPIRVQITSKPPGAEVLVDNERRGITPVTLSLERRAYRLGLRFDGFQPVEQPLDLSTLQQTTLDVDVPLRLLLKPPPRKKPDEATSIPVFE